MLEREFNGSRLREGRVLRGYTITELAEKLGISKQMVSKYEYNKAIPTFEVLMSIINILEFPKSYFYEESIPVYTGNTYFRSLLSTGKRERERQYDWLKYLTITRVFLEEYVDFPELNIPDLISENAYDIEQVATDLRNHWGLGDSPIKDIVFLLEKKGFIMTSLSLNNKTIDAFGAASEINGKSYYTIALGNEKRSFYRRQFDVAHELGHKVLHDPFLNINDLNKEEFKQIENEANDFAAAFLMPKESFIKDVSIHPNDLMYYKHLKKTWGVSISAMVMRAFKLGVISESTYKYMQRSISKNGWRRVEPLDDLKEIKNPVAMKQAVELLIENEYISSSELINKLSNHYGLSLFRGEIEELLGLDQNYLREKDTSELKNLVSLKQIRETKNEKSV